MRNDLRAKASMCDWYQRRGRGDTDDGWKAYWIIGGVRYHISPNPTVCWDWE